MSTRTVVPDPVRRGTSRTSRGSRARAVGRGLGVVLLGIVLLGCGDSTAAGGPGAPQANPAPEPIRGPASGSAPAAVRELRELERRRLQHLVAADVDRAAALHADEFELIPPPGYPMGREEYLDAVGSGDLDYLVFEPISEIEVRVQGTVAVLWYESRIDVAVSGLGRFEHDTWHLYLYERRSGGWQVVREQATAVGGFPPPAE